jgi:hypothetical protein
MCKQWYVYQLLSVVRGLFRPPPVVLARFSPQPSPRFFPGITRDGRLFIPNGATTIRLHDKMVFIGTSMALDTPAADFFKHDRKVKTVSIIGGGSVGFMLAEKLERTGIKVKLIKQLGSRRIVTRVGNIQNCGLFEHVGIDVVVSPKASALTEVLNRIQAQKVDVIAPIEQDAAIGFVGTAATIGNIGPGFGAIGPIGSFGNLHLATKIIFTVDMIVGRLELIPFLAMLSPEFWSFARN